MNCTEEELVTLISAAEVAGQDRSVNELRLALWQQLEPQLRALVRGFVRYVRGACLDEDDLMQEAYLKFHRVLSRYDPERGVRLRSWLKTVLTHLFIQFGRRRVELARVALENVAVAAASADLGEELAWVERVLATLLPDDPQRVRKLAVFKQHVFEERTFESLARQEHVAISTVYRWVQSIKTRLARLGAPEQPADNRPARRVQRQAA
jgi:RNA polymerase sigma factor (sigma-70 family)